MQKAPALLHAFSMWGLRMAMQRETASLHVMPDEEAVNDVVERMNIKASRKLFLLRHRSLVA